MIHSLPASWYRSRALAIILLSELAKERTSILTTYGGLDATDRSRPLSSVYCNIYKVHISLVRPLQPSIMLHHRSYSLSIVLSIANLNTYLACLYHQWIVLTSSVRRLPAFVLSCSFKLWAQTQAAVLASQVAHLQGCGVEARTRRGSK